LLIERLPKVATPATAAWVNVPLSVPLPGFAPRATVTCALLVLTRFPPASWICTVIGGAIEEPAAELEGCWLKASVVAAPAVMLKGLLAALVNPVLLAVSV